MGKNKRIEIELRPYAPHDVIPVTDDTTVDGILDAMTAEEMNEMADELDGGSNAEDKS